MIEINPIDPSRVRRRTETETVDISTGYGLSRLGAALPYLTDEEKSKIVEQIGGGSTKIQLPSQGEIKSRVSAQIWREMEDIREKISEELRRRMG